MEKQYYVVRRSDDTLSHAQKGKERAGHKYVKREWKNNRWQYWYKDDQGNLTTNKPTASANANINTQLSPSAPKSGFAQLFEKGKASISNLFTKTVQNIDEAINKGKEYINNAVDYLDKRANSGAAIGGGVKPIMGAAMGGAVNAAKNVTTGTMVGAGKNAYEEGVRIAEEVARNRKEKEEKRRQTISGLMKSHEEAEQKEKEERRQAVSGLMKSHEEAEQKEKEAKRQAVSGLIESRKEADQRKEEEKENRQTVLNGIAERGRPKQQYPNVQSKKPDPDGSSNGKERAGELVKDLGEKFKETTKEAMSKNTKEKEKERQAAQRELEEKREARDKAGELLKDIAKTIVYEPTKEIAEDAAEGLKNYKDPRVKKMEELVDILTMPVTDYVETTRNRLAMEKFIEEQKDKLDTYVDTKLRPQGRRR